MRKQLRSTALAILTMSSMLLLPQTAGARSVDETQAVDSVAAAGSCPERGSLCVYRDNDFLGFMQSVPDNTQRSLSMTATNKTSSIRNRTSGPCYVYDYPYESQGGPSQRINPGEIARIGYVWGPFWNDNISRVDCRASPA